jgi:hypothetical protein
MSFFPLDQFYQLGQHNPAQKRDVTRTRGSLGLSEGCGTNVSPRESVFVMECCVVETLSDSIPVGVTSRSSTNACIDDSFSAILCKSAGVRSGLH